MTALDTLPVIIGAGQAQWDTPSDLDNAPGPAELAGQALDRAFADSGMDERSVDLCFAVRLFGDSGPAFPNPFGSPDNLGAAALKRAGGRAARHVYSWAGGEQPQTLVSEAARLLMDGDAGTVAIVGAEAIGTVKAAGRAGAAPDWSETTGVPMEDRGPFDPKAFPVSPQAIAHRIASPVYYYALMESARRAALGESEPSYRARMGELWAHFAAVAADNPFATLRSAPRASEIVTPGPGNPMISSPYTRNMVARDGVNLGAAVLLTTYASAKAMGVRDVTFLHAHDQAGEPHPITRTRPDRAPAQEAVLAGLKGRTDMMDLYSCFPIVPLEAMRILDVEIGEQPLTLTGGLPFFGGPGNNYSLHAIAEAHARVRGTDRMAGVYANGGMASKHAAGLYGGRPPERVVLRKSADTQPGKAVFGGQDPAGEVIAATVEYRRGEATGVLLMGETEAGERFYARAGVDAVETDWIGERVRTETGRDGQNRVG